MVHSLLGGWQISGLVAYQSGNPFSITNGGTYGDNAGAGNGVGTGSYVDVIGNQGPLLFNPGAFADPTGLTFGNAGRNILYNPPRANWDMGVFKRFILDSNEARAFEFRAEGFNVLNHTQWSGVNNSATCYAGANNSAGDPSCVASATCLQPSGAHNPRILQLGLKVFFRLQNKEGPAPGRFLLQWPATLVQLICGAGVPAQVN